MDVNGFNELLFAGKMKVKKDFEPTGEAAKPGTNFYIINSENYLGRYRYMYEKDATEDAKRLAKILQEEVVVLKPLTVVSPKVEVEVKKVRGY